MTIMKATTWRRRTSTDTFSMRGRTTLLFPEMGMILRGVGLSRLHDGSVVVEMPRTTRREPDGSAAYTPIAVFSEEATRDAFADAAWAAVSEAFADAANAPIHTTLYSSPIKPRHLPQRS